MKTFFYMLCLLSFSLLPAQQKSKDFKNIMSSKSIYEIDAFLNVAHPDDPRRRLLKPRLMDLIKDYIKNAHPEDQRIKELQEKLALLKKRPNTKISFDEMNAIIKQKQIQKYREELEKQQRGIAANKPDIQPSYTDLTQNYGSGTPAVNPEQDEFNMLMNPSDDEHKRQTVNLLNSLFDNDPNSKEAIVMVENKSTCDIIVRLEGPGNTKYRLAVPSNKENSIVVQKGSYLFTSLVCGAQYASQKTVQKAIMVALGNPGNSNINLH